jgi:hypothetical protein
VSANVIGDDLDAKELVSMLYRSGSRVRFVSFQTSLYTVAIYEFSAYLFLCFLSQFAFVVTFILTKQSYWKSVNMSVFSSVLKCCNDDEVRKGQGPRIL